MAPPGWTSHSRGKVLPPLFPASPPDQSSFADLIYRLSHPPRPVSQRTGLAETLSPSTIFTSWLNHHRPLPPGFGKRLFRLLYPHEGSRRRYGLKETKLSREIEETLGLGGLTKWDGVTYDGHEGTGCLGREVEVMMKDRVSHPPSLFSCGLLGILTNGSDPKRPKVRDTHLRYRQNARSTSLLVIILSTLPTRSFDSHPHKPPDQPLPSFKSLTLRLSCPHSDHPP